MEQSAADILFAIRTKGARVWVSEGQLRYEAPAGALSAGDLQTLRRYKPEILALLAHSEARVQRSAALAPRQPDELIPLTILQWHSFNRIRLDGGQTNLLPVVTVRLSGPLDVAALERALRALIDRHEALRMQITSREGAPRQQVVAFSRLPLKRRDLSGGPPAAREASAKNFIRDLVSARTNLIDEPLFIAHLLVLDAHDHVLLLTMDHMLFDLPAMQILHSDLAALYAEAAHGTPSRLPTLPVQFADYAVWQQKGRRTRVDVHDEYWDRRLEGAGHLQVFAEEGQFSDVPRANRLRFTLPPALTSALRASCAAHRTTPMMSLLTAYAATLSRWCQCGDLVLSVPSTARRHPDLQRTVGNFGTVFYLRIHVRADDTFLSLQERVIEEFNGAYEHDDAGKRFAQTPRPPFASNPVFNFNADPLPAVSWGGTGDADSLRGAAFPVSLPFPDDFVRALREPTLFIADHGELTGSIGYRSDRVRTTTVKRFEQAFQSIVRSAVEDPARALP